MYEIEKYIDAHFLERIQIREVAESFFVSPGYLAHCFKSCVGYTPMQYLMLNRLSYARELLRQVDMPIGVVAFRSGFSDVNNFMKSFKKRYGITPKTARLGDPHFQELRPRTHGFVEDAVHSSGY